MPSVLLSMLFLREEFGPMARTSRGIDTSSWVDLLTRANLKQYTGLGLRHPTLILAVTGLSAG